MEVDWSKELRDGIGKNVKELYNPATDFFFKTYRTGQSDKDTVNNSSFVGRHI